MTARNWHLLNRFKTVIGCIVTRKPEAPALNSLHRSCGSVLKVELVNGTQMTWDLAGNCLISDREEVSQNLDAIKQCPPPLSSAAACAHAHAHAGPSQFVRMHTYGNKHTHTLNQAMTCSEGLRTFQKSVFARWNICNLNCLHVSNRHTACVWK